MILPNANTLQLSNKVLMCAGLQSRASAGRGESFPVPAKFSLCMEWPDPGWRDFRYRTAGWLPSLTHFRYVRASRANLRATCDSRRRTGNLPCLSTTFDAFSQRALYVQSPRSLTSRPGLQPEGPTRLIRIQDGSSCGRDCASPLGPPPSSLSRPAMPPRTESPRTRTVSSLGRHDQ